jgi:hypothetical protein
MISILGHETRLIAVYASILSDWRLVFPPESNVLRFFFLGFLCFTLTQMRRQWTDELDDRTVCDDEL